MSADRIRPGSARRPQPDDQPSSDPRPVDEIVVDTPVEEGESSEELLSTAVVAEAAAAVELESAPPEVVEPEVVVPVGAPAVANGEVALNGAAQPSPSRRGFFMRLYHGETRIDFVRRKRIWFAFSSAVILVGIISLATRGLNFGIEFVGGTSWTVKTATLAPTTLQSDLSSVLPGATITVLGGGSNRQVQVQAKLPKGESSTQQTNVMNTVTSKVAAAAHVDASAVETESVGPSWGSQITNKAIIALIVFFVMISLYVSIFFEWRMALAAIVAVTHDILVTVGIYSLTGLQVTSDTVVAFLTILGYSLYDTIVVFDRVRDNTKNLSVRDRLTFSDVVNVSMNQTLARSINTSLVAIMPIFAVLVLGAEILGATTLQYFGFALLVGLLTGAYSSIFIASPLVAIMKEREPRYRQLRERLSMRGGERILLSAADVATNAFGDLSPRRVVADVGESSAPRDAASPRPSGPRPSTRPQSRRPANRNRPKGGRR